MQHLEQVIQMPRPEEFESMVQEGSLVLFSSLFDSDVQVTAMEDSMKMLMKRKEEEKKPSDSCFSPKSQHTCIHELSTLINFYLILPGSIFYSVYLHRGTSVLRKMAAKRSASAQLTSDNWEQEDENEEVIYFKINRMILFHCSPLKLDL